VRDAGLPVELTCHPADVLVDDRFAGSGAGLAAYRIVQEALTNVMRHEGLVPTRVEVRLDGPRLCVAVANVLGAGAGPPGVAGRGLVGMRERATALGGTFEAAAVGGEFVVTASLPLRSGTRG